MRYELALQVYAGLTINRRGKGRGQDPTELITCDKGFMSIHILTVQLQGGEQMRSGVDASSR